jgi:Domain of unknown function (DUF1905)
MIEGSINGSPFQAALEPDGRGSHWFRVVKTMLESAGANAGDTVTLDDNGQGWPGVAGAKDGTGATRLQIRVIRSFDGHR